MNWELFEIEVYETLKVYYPNAKIERDIKRDGRYSHKARQIDILIEEIVGDKVIRIVVECKYYNKPIDVKTVESFISMADDLAADFGLMITEKGYSKTALKRAYYNPKEIMLDILSLSELKEMQEFMALPYSEDNAALLLAPFGWVVDGTKRNGAICMLYQRGLTFEQAAEKKELAYINYWNRKKNGEDLKNLLELQKIGIERHVSSLGFTLKDFYYINNNQRTDAKTIIRVVEIVEYPGIEITGFIEFEDFIFFCVWFSDPLNIKINISKLKKILKTTIPIKIIKNSG